MSRIRLIPILSLVAPLLCHADDTLTFSSGFDYSTGKYGASQSTETLYIPLGAKYESGNWTWRATIPYVESTGPSTVSGSGADRVTLEDRQTVRRKAAGLGDVVLAASRTIWAQGPWLIDLGTKFKLATADKDEGLGTGKNDYTVQAEVYRMLDSHTLFGTLGYKRMGDPDGIDLRDPFFTSLGWSYRASQKTSVGASYDYREKITDTGAPLREMTGFLTHKLDEHWKVQTYLVTGFSKASPDLGGGVFVFYAY